MSVKGKQLEGRTVIWIPTNANRDLGTFLVFLGVTIMVVLHYGFDPATPGIMAGTVGGLLVAIAGFFLLRFSRKRFSVSEGLVVVKDGIFKRGLHYRWEVPPAIRLRPQEEEHNGKIHEYWLVYLVDGKRQYALDHRLGDQIESRSLAEALAKSINCPVIEKGDEGEIRIEREDLDLPFMERVRRWPSLLGVEVEKPEYSQVEVDESDGQQRYFWRLMSSALMTEVFTLVFLLLLLGLVPLFPGRLVQHPGDVEPTRAPMERSFFDLARDEHDFTYFYVVGVFTALASIGLFGYSKELSVSRQQLSVRDRLWGLPLAIKVIPAQQLEEIWVRKSSRGAHLQFISDALIISGRIASIEVASWVASKVRRYYAS